MIDSNTYTNSSLHQPSSFRETSQAVGRGEGWVKVIYSVKFESRMLKYIFIEA